jgi:cytochrome oxidase assembly protein ShyY1
MRLVFHFRWIPFFAAVAAALLGIALGNWHERRAEEKQGIEKAMLSQQAQPVLQLNTLQGKETLPEFRRVVAEGEFIAGWPVYLDNRPSQGRAGFYLLMPLRLHGSEQVVMVARGWFPRDQAVRTKLPTIPVKSGQVRIEGVIRHTAGRVLSLGQDVPLQPGAIVQNLNLAEFGRASGLSLQDHIIEQTNDTNDQLVRDWPRPSFGVDKHRGYAFQWYALAATAFLFFVLTGFRRASKTDNTRI